MGTLNAFAFSLLGTLMGFLPALLPSYFPSAGMAGSSASELWLEFMGFLQGSLGTFYIVRNEIVPLLLRALAWGIPTFGLPDRPQAGVILRPTAADYLRGADTRARRAAA